MKELRRGLGKAPLLINLYRKNIACLTTFAAPRGR